VPDQGNSKSVVSKGGTAATGDDGDLSSSQPKALEGGSTVDERAPHPSIRLEGPFDVEKHRGHLALYLIALLALIVLGHYVATLVLEWNGKKAEGLATAFNTVLPVISGLVSGAVTYYFTKK